MNLQMNGRSAITQTRCDSCSDLHINRGKPASITKLKRSPGGFDEEGNLDRFSDPVIAKNLSSKPRTVEIDLEASTTRLKILNNKSTEVFAYNSTIPGPTIEAYEGDHLIIHFKNNLQEPTTVHWHGLHIPSDQDGNPMSPVLSGQKRDYIFDIPFGTAGTYWYHPHTEGLTASQVAKGLYGGFVVRSASDPIPSSIKENIILLSDNRFDVNGEIEANTKLDQMNGREGNIIFVNGQTQPELIVISGEVRRLRIINASSARYYLLNIPKHNLILIGTDGGLIESPVVQKEILLAPGERIEVLVRFNGKPDDKTDLRSLSYDRGIMAEAPASMGGMTSMPTNQEMKMTQTTTKAITLLRFQYARTAVVSSGAIPSSFRQIPATSIQGAEKRSFTFSENMESLDFRINGKKYDSTRVDTRTKLGKTEIWSIANQGDMDHPFHLHGFSFQVLDRNGIPEPFRAWKDTVNIIKNQTVSFVVRFEDFPGKRMYHCHILDHEQLGMMGILQVDSE